MRSHQSQEGLYCTVLYRTVLYCTVLCGHNTQRRGCSGPPRASMSYNQELIRASKSYHLLSPWITIMNYRTSLPKQKAIIYHDFDLLLWATVSYKCRFHKIIDCYNHQMLLWLFSPEFSPPSGSGSYISLVSCRNGGEWIKCLTCFLTLMEKYVWKTSNLTKLSAQAGSLWPHLLCALLLQWLNVPRAYTGS